MSHNATMTGPGQPPSSTPNPLTPMAFLPPNFAFEVTMSLYISIGSCSVLLWDVLDNLKVDVVMMFTSRFNYVPLVFIISRLSTLTHILTSVTYQSAPVADCSKLESVLVWLYTVSVTSTSLLFLFRLRAIYNRDLYVTSGFALLWLGILAGCVVATHGSVTVGRIGPTSYCVITGVRESLSTALVIMPFINDTLIFFAISWRLMKVSTEHPDLKTRLRIMFLGNTMSKFMKTLLHDGQKYYLTTIVTNLVFILLLYTKGVSGAFKAILSLPNMVLMNIMACRVFRKTKLGLFETESMPTTVEFGLPISVSGVETMEISPERVQDHEARGNKRRVHQDAT